MGDKLLKSCPLRVGSVVAGHEGLCRDGMALVFVDRTIGSIQSYVGYGLFVGIGVGTCILYLVGMTNLAIAWGERREGSLGLDVGVEEGVYNPVGEGVLRWRLSTWIGRYASSWTVGHHGVLCWSCKG